MDWISDPHVWIGLLTFMILEIVLGVDNVVFISILAGQLPESVRAAAWRIGPVNSLLVRLGLTAIGLTTIVGDIADRHRVVRMLNS